MRKIALFISVLLMAMWPLVASAYVGPGLGVGALGVIIGIISSIFLAIVGIFWYPIKRFIRKIRGSKAEDEE